MSVNRLPDVAGEDDRRLRQLGYEPELARGMNGFSNFAISLSIICILAGGITSFPVGLSSAGGASFGLGGPLMALFSLCVAATMAQIASAFPTAGGLYHWGSILGGRTCGWFTAWFNLAGLITVLAAVNAGTFDFAVAVLGVEAPTAAVWTTTALGVGLTLLVPYPTIAAVCAILLYLSYVLPIAAGLRAHGRTWRHFGPWHLGRWYVPLAWISVLGCLGLLFIGVQPPNDLAVPRIGGCVVTLSVAWFASERRRFQGPPATLLKE